MLSRTMAIGLIVSKVKGQSSPVTMKQTDYQVWQKSNRLKLVCFLSNRLDFLCEILNIYVTILSTLNCQVAFNSL